MIGGSAPDFDVTPLGDRVFRFSISSKWVGFHIVSLRSFDCLDYKIFFHLWGRGGPNWRQEWTLFCAEEDASWTKVQNRALKHQLPNNHAKESPSFADAVKSNLLTGTNRVPIAQRSEFIARHDRHAFESQDSQNSGKKPIGSVHRGQADHINLDLNLNPGASFGQGRSANNRFSVLAPGICSRCLSKGHVRALCRSPIRCFACRGVGHVAANCRSKQVWKNSENGPWKKDTDLRLHPPMQCQDLGRFMARPASQDLFNSLEPGSGDSLPRQGVGHGLNQWETVFATMTQ
ncbi:hypothetical protein BDA96_06G101200 [Sorghum bicolor]|uniref:CCHC-type domain-containing protein n=1 Tax=Sorghum bicolor TaxID=4558 RepID=A0A921QS71_SORBI|nr:hypothetical protein BDA96_06G101200 [Sorghum bicolor]